MDGILLQSLSGLWLLTPGLQYALRLGGEFAKLANVFARELRHLIRTRFRREANVADNKAATVAVDSLINYEAVKVRSGNILSLYLTHG